MDKLSYALGVMMAKNFASLGITDFNIDDLKSGLIDETKGNPLITMNEIEKLLQDFSVKSIGEKFLAANALKDGVVTTKSGLQYKVINEGTGKHPTINSRITCHYEGRFTNNQIFDSSYKRNQEATFTVNQVIPGWVEGLQLMKEGSEYEFYIPSNLAYGKNGVPNVIPPDSVLIFKVKLIKVL